MSNLANGTWYHLAGTFDGRYMRLYVNGTNVASYDLGVSGQTITYSYPGNSVFLGADPTTTSAPQGMYFGGEIDEVRIWSNARSQAQLQAAMSNEIDYTVPAQTTALLAYYTFNQGTAAGNNSNLTQLTDFTGNNPGVFYNFALTGSGSNYTAQRAATIVLPVQWLSFTAQATPAGNQLQWTTAAEENTASFRVEWSADGRTWSEAGARTAAGNSGRYMFLHAYTGPAHYRIRCVDRDGRSTYGRIIALGSPGAGLQVSVEGRRMQVTASETGTLLLYTTDGRLAKRYAVRAGTQQLGLNGLTPGVYLLRLNQQQQRILVP